MLQDKKATLSEIIRVETLLWKKRSKPSQGATIKNSEKNSNFTPVKMNGYRPFSPHVRTLSSLHYICKC